MLQQDQKQNELEKLLVRRRLMGSMPTDDDSNRRDQTMEDKWLNVSDRHAPGDRGDLKEWAKNQGVVLQCCDPHQCPFHEFVIGSVDARPDQPQLPAQVGTWGPDGPDHDPSERPTDWRACFSLCFTPQTFGANSGAACSFRRWQSKSNRRNGWACALR